MPEILIREARSGDAAAIVDFQLRMARETESLELDPETVTRGVGAVLADPAKGRYWIAESAGQVAGCLLTTFEWSDWRDGTVWWIQSVYVLPGFRGRGIYRALYLHLKAKVESSPELKGLRLYVDVRNTAAQQVYQRLGMSSAHYLLYEWLKGDAGSPARPPR